MGYTKKQRLNDDKEEGFYPVERKHCPDCCMYLDGKKMAYEETGAPVFSPIAGMQHHRYSDGDLHSKIGFMTPCHCVVGDRISEAYKSTPGLYKHEPRMELRRPRRNNRTGQYQGSDAA